MCWPLLLKEIKEQSSVSRRKPATAIAPDILTITVTEVRSPAKDILITARKARPLQVSGAFRILLKDIGPILDLA